MKETVLQTKLFTPPVRPLSIPRPHLIQKLNNGLSGKLTLVSAPPGFGKTTLVSSWLQQSQRPFTWLSLDKEDNDPTRFLTYLFAALQKIEGNVGQTAISLLHSPQSPPPEMLLTLLINDLAALPAPIILTLEDYHTINNLDIHKALAFLLDNLPFQLHLVITSREDPPLPIYRLRSSGQMNGIYAHDLRFTLNEAADFLQHTMNVQLTSEDVAKLAQRTEGWIAGLQLAALSMQGLPDTRQFVADFAGDDRYIADYLLHEVVERQPPHIQEFLLRSAVFDRFCPALCDAILGTTPNISQDILTQLDELNLFIVPLDNKRQWYRYHNLFADFLRLRWHERSAGEINTLHRQAACWFEIEGQLAEAIDHNLAGEDYEQAARLIEQNGMSTIFGHAQWETFLNWMQALPPQMVQERPQLNLHFAWGLFSTGQWPAAEPYLQGVESALRNINKTEEQKWMLGEVAAIRALVSYEMGELHRSKEMAALAHELLPQENKTIRGVAALAEAMANMWSDLDLQTQHRFLQRACDLAQEAGNTTVVLFALDCRTMLDVRAGRLQQAARNYQQARMLGTVEGKVLLGPAGMACIQMGEVLREWNKLSEAEALLWEGVKLCQQQSGMPVWIIEGHVNLARLKLATGDEPEAEKLIKQAKLLLADLPKQGETVQHLVSTTLAYRVRYWLAQGQLDKAAGWLAKNGITLNAAVSPQNAPFHILLARTLIQQGQLENVQTQLQRLKKVLNQNESLRLSIEYAVLRALWLQDRGNQTEAVQALSQALLLAEPQGYQRIFLEEGEQLSPLLAMVKVNGATAVYVQTLREAIQSQLPLPAEKTPTPDLMEPLTEPLIELLTEREEQILRLMAAGLSNRDIAAELFLSHNTIKAYTSRIYGKLSVTNRAEAIHRAYQLNLL